MILIVDDNPTVTASLALLLKQSGYSCRTTSSPEEALSTLKDTPVALVIQDMNFSRQTTGKEGLDLLRRIKAAHPRIPVILITAWGSIELAVQGIKDGAADFITKPWSNQQLLQSVQTTLDLAGAKQEVSVSRKELDSTYDFEDILGEHPSFLKALEVTGRVAATDASVLITGESGTGKELIAEAVHRNSSRNRGPFVKVNLGGISSTLFESEMFGHVRGAFTDARQTRKGRFEMANGGTIFLDEIGDLDVNSQVKMLRVLQDRTYEVLGSSVTRSLDIRVVSATNRNLPEMVTKQEFREDLFYRLNLIVVHLPPLRERLGDIDLLARHFADKMGTVYRHPGLSLTDHAFQYLGELKWPGNVRQLRQVIERAVLVSSGNRLDVQDFVLAAEMEPGGRLEESLPSPGSMTLDEIEKAMIVKCLRAYKGNISKVAEALGTSRGALYRRLEKHGLKQ